MNESDGSEMPFSKNRSRIACYTITKKSESCVPKFRKHADFLPERQVLIQEIVYPTNTYLAY